MSRPTHRRDFVRTLALGTTAGALTTPARAPADEPDPTPDRLERDSTEADARMALIVARFGGHLDDEARKSVRSEVESIVRRVESLRTYPLDNGDAPMPMFVAYRAPLAP